jgi:hypothetical protein
LQAHPQLSEAADETWAKPAWTNPAGKSIVDTTSNIAEAIAVLKGFIF